LGGSLSSLPFPFLCLRCTDSTRLDSTKLTDENAMRLLLSLLSWLFLARVCVAVPLQHARDESRTIITDPETGRTFVPGETATDRTIYNVVGLSCAVVLSVFLGTYMDLASSSSFSSRMT
jgi:hypothetical protein